MAAQMTSEKAKEFMAAAKAKAAASIASVKRKLETYDETSKAAFMEVLAAAEVGGIAFMFGYIRGFYGEKKYLGIPVEGWVALACHGIGLYLNFTAKPEKAGEFDRMIARQFHNVGNGALAAWGHTMGAAMGAEAKEAKGAAAPATAGYPAQLTTGAYPPPREMGMGNHPMTQEELMRAEALA
jgi:hypothetical protein